MQIAKTVQGIATRTNPLADAIMNREVNLTRTLIEAVMSQTQFSYHGRKPRSARAANGQVRTTDLDLLSLLCDLYKRSAQVELTAYENKLPWQAYAGEQHVGGTKRYGNITGLISHRELLSFSLRIKDQSVLTSVDGDMSIGAQRSYMIADYTGDWNKGWHGFSWDMNSQEQAYLERRNLLVDGKIECKDYLHLNRRQSVLGAPYLLLKLLHQRIEDEISFFERECTRLERAHVTCPFDLQSTARYRLAQGASQSVAVPTFTMRLDGLSYKGEYTPVSTDELGYRLAHRSIRFLALELRPIVQFIMRADEVAFYRFGLEQGYIPHWVTGTSWVHSGPSAATINLGETLRLSYQIGQVEKKVAA